MNAVPAARARAGLGHPRHGDECGQVLSIGVFFTLMIIGLALSLPAAMESHLVAQGLPQAVAAQVASVPPVASLFAAFLGYNPMGELIPRGAAALTAAQQATITGPHFFPELLRAVHGGHQDRLLDLAGAVPGGGAGLVAGRGVATRSGGRSGAGGVQARSSALEPAMRGWSASR